MNKLTAFVVLPKDALKFSYSWLKQFVIEQIKETVAVALELAIVNGDGVDKPVGLIKDLDKSTTDGKKITFATEKEPIADFSDLDAKEAAPTLFAPVMKGNSFQLTDKVILKNRW